MSIGTNDFFQENTESDSDSNSDPADEYQPISAFDDGDSDVEAPIEINGSGFISHPGEYESIAFPNPTHNVYDLNNGFHGPEHGISNLSLNSSGYFNGRNESGGGNDDDEEEAEEERSREAAEQEISRAFTEDERRRNAPLTPENASRIVDVMREISFRGFPPDWADRVPEDQWVDRLRRLREPASQS